MWQDVPIYAETCRDFLVLTSVGLGQMVKLKIVQNEKLINLSKCFFPEFKVQVSGQNAVPFNKVARFSDHPYFQKLSINILDFFKKVVSEERKYYYIYFGHGEHTQLSINLLTPARRVFRSFEEWAEIENSLESESFIYFMQKNLSYIIKNALDQSNCKVL